VPDVLLEHKQTYPANKFVVENTEFDNALLGMIILILILVLLPGFKRAGRGLLRKKAGSSFGQKRLDIFAFCIVHL
jgi:hypothetical protein